MQNSFLLGKNKELLSRCFFTLAMLLICRIGSFVPIAGVDSTSLNELVNRNQDGILGMFNLLSGGSLARMSVFALAIMPYITASIIIQLLSVVYQPLEKLKKDGEIGKQQINQITRCLTVFLAALQAFGVAMSLEKMTTTVGPVVIIPGLFFKVTTVLTLVVGTMFLMWIGEQISAKGIGNGSSLIIFVGIVSGIPNAIITSLKLARSGELSGILVLLILIFLLFLVACIIFFEKAQRRVVVQYPKRQIGNKIYGGDTTHLPLKLNTAGVIPPIFASSILLFPLTIANLSSNSDSRILNWISSYLGHGKPLFVVLYAFLIVFFAIFYTAIVFNTEDTANNLKKYNAYIPGVRPGKNTAEYFDNLLIKLSSIGAIYLCCICIVPEILVNKFAAAFTLGGTSLLIVVNVVLDTFATVQTYMFTSRYDVLIKKMKNKR